MNKYLIALWIAAGAIFLAGIATVLASRNGVSDIFDPAQVADSLTGLIVGAALIMFGIFAAIAALATSAIAADIRTATRKLNETNARNDYLRQIRQNEGRG